MSSISARSCTSAFLLLLAGCPAQEPLEPVATVQAASETPDRTAEESIAGLLAPYEAALPTWEQLQAIDPEPSGALIALAESGASPAIRQNAVVLLGLAPTPEASERLRSALGDPARPQLQAAAIQAVSPRLRDDPELRAIVEGLLISAHVPTQRAAIAALGEVPASKKALLALDGHPLPGTSRAALDAALGRDVAPPVTPVAVPTGGGRTARNAD